MKKTPIFIIAVLSFGLIAGFFLGMEYKAYQIRITIEKAFTSTPATLEKSKSVIEQAKKEEAILIEKSIGDEITLATMKFKVSGAEEAQTVSQSFGSPNVAKEGAKFVIIKLSLTNITTSEFDFDPNGLMLIDNQKREFSHYHGMLGNNIDLRTLPPSITENGILVYEVAADATSYSLVIGKAGTKDLYKVLLK